MFQELCVKIKWLDDKNGEDRRKIPEKKLAVVSIGA
jgi:hypothetical protein